MIFTLNEKEFFPAVLQFSAKVWYPVSKPLSLFNRRREVPNCNDSVRLVRWYQITVFNRTVGFSSAAGSFTWTLNILLDAKKEDDCREWREFILSKHRILISLLNPKTENLIMSLRSHSRGGGGGGGGGGEVLSFFLHTQARAQHLPFTPTKISGISSTPQKFWNFSSPKNTPYSVPWP